MIDPNALVCLEPGRLQIERRALPVRGDGDALVRPLRIGICGTDYHIYEGTHPFLKYPRVMGHELAVEVVEAPPHLDLNVGDTCVVNPYLSCGYCIACRAGKPNCCVNISVLGVHRDGGMADLLVLPAKNLIRGDGLTADQCAIVEFLSIGAHAVRRGGVSAADRVLVVGAGPIGIGVALFAGLTGARVGILDRERERAETARRLTGTEIIPAEGNLAAAVQSFTNGEGFEVVFDATGNSKAMEAGFDHVAHGGRYVLVSVVKEAITFRDPDLHRKEMSLFGSRNATVADFKQVMAAIRERKIDADALITHRTTLADAVVDIPRWATQKVGLIKALIEADTDRLG
ncbi:MAG TPA: zinc-binding alcohol dehydrogenase family protein [Bauldia sp.]|nr:zinc-binding alcohol dehydrogenase family protein [Bauldia sp.]